MFAGIAVDFAVGDGRARRHFEATGPIRTFRLTQYVKAWATVLVHRHGTHAGHQPIRALCFGPNSKEESDALLNAQIIFRLHLHNVAGRGFASSLVGYKDELDGVAWLQDGIVLDFGKVEEEFLT